MYLIVYLFVFWSSGAGKKSTAPSSAQSEEFEDDPYATLQVEQRKRELQWKNQRAAKKSKEEKPAVRQTTGIPSETTPSEVICTVIEKVANQSDHTDQTDQLKKQLEAKTKNVLI